MENGYYVTKPADPQKQNATFEGWYTLDGTAFDFDGVVTESKTVYAKWNGDEVTYQAGANSTQPTNDNLIVYVFAALLLLVAIVVGVLIIKGGLKRDKDTK